MLSPARDPRHAVAGTVLSGPVRRRNHENCLLSVPVLPGEGGCSGVSSIPGSQAWLRMEQIVLLCHSQLWACQLASLREQASRRDVGLPLIWPAPGFLLAPGQPGLGPESASETARSSSLWQSLFCSTGFKMAAQLQSPQLTLHLPGEATG